MKPGDWRDDEKQFLKDSWATMSAGFIGDRLGRTRNAVIGQAHRLGMLTKGKRRFFTKENERKPTTRHRPMLFKARPELPYSGAIPLIESDAFHCKAIIDGQKDKNGLVMVCGKPIVDGQPFSFCSDHLERYTIRRYAR